jgi:hypothetical protein
MRATVFALAPTAPDRRDHAARDTRHSADRYFGPIVSDPSEIAQSPMLIDIWTVDPSRRDELIAGITSTMQSVVMRQPGFVGAQIYQSVDHGVVLLSVAMRTTKERQHLMDSAEAHGALRELRTIAKSHSHLFELVESFGAHGSAHLKSS